MTATAPPRHRATAPRAHKHEVMAVLARNMSDEDISQIAAWFASLKVEVQPPP